LRANEAGHTVLIIIFNEGGARRQVRQERQNNGWRLKSYEIESFVVLGVLAVKWFA
jgi:hypothetical protein